MEYTNGEMVESMKDSIRKINKHGYGIYYWADGRKYEGYWAQGKQHGLGRYIIPQESQERYGLWEDGKRIEWFENEQISDINNHRIEYKLYFRREDSINH